MKKFFAFAAAAVMTAGLISGCGGDTETAKESGERTTFTVGFDAEFPPYGYMDDNGEYTGFDLELAQEVCDRTDGSW